MTKLFITLYLVVLASFGIFVGFMISLDALEDLLPASKNIEERITKGSFMLLDRSIEGLTAKQTEQLVVQHKKAFDEFFALIELAQLDLNPDEIDRLKQGEIVASDEEDDALEDEYAKTNGHKAIQIDLYYKKVPNATLVWRVNLDTEVNQHVNNITITTTVKSGRFAHGMQYLIHAYLLKYNEDQWQSILKNLQTDYGLLLSLHEKSVLLASLGNKQAIQSRISKGELVNMSQGTHSAIFVQAIPHSTKMLQIGPIKIPWIIAHTIQLALLAFVLSIATALCLWVRAFWSNLIKIKQAADEFGAGNYSARIPYKKRSPIAEVTKAFNAMAECTQRSIRSHKELTSAVSHELRTPVARMRFALEMLSATDDKEDQQRFVNAINNDIDELDLLLEELLTYARFDQQDTAMKLHEVPLIPWLDASMKQLIPLATHKNLDYRLEGIGVNETAWIEPRLMSRVLDNLVQNALRYAKQYVKVTLTKDNNDYLLVVEDDGTGIPDTERAHIFDAFSRLDASRDRASGGFGLGLAIAERIVKGHQGTLTIDDSVLGGARFEVRYKGGINK
jgi:signal transduction histidine kinase